MPRIALLALALVLSASSSALAMGGSGGVGAGGAGFGLPLWQPSPADDSGYALRHPVRRAYGHVRPHHHSRYRPQ